MRRKPSWAQKSKRELFQRIFALGIFWGGVSCYAATPFIVDLTPIHSDITRFRPRSSFVTGNHLDRSEKIRNLLRRLIPLTIWSAIRHFGTHFAESFRMSKSSWMMGSNLSRQMPTYSAIDLAENRRFSKINSWIWSITCGVVTVLGRPGRGASQVEKSPLLMHTNIKYQSKHTSFLLNNYYLRATCFDSLEPSSSPPWNRSKIF
jgi:hypothetical protein